MHLQMRLERGKSVRCPVLCIHISMAQWWPWVLKKRLSNNPWVLFAMSWNKWPIHFRTISTECPSGFSLRPSEPLIARCLVRCHASVRTHVRPVRTPKRTRVCEDFSGKKKPKLHRNSYFKNAFEKSWCGRRSPGSHLALPRTVFFPRPACSAQGFSQAPQRFLWAASTLSASDTEVLVLWRFGSGQQRLLPRCVGVGELLITVKYAEHKRCRFSHFKAALVAHVHICANIATPPSPELFHPPNLNPPPVRL